MRKYLEDFRDRIFDLGCRISDDFLIPARNQLRPNVLVYAKPISLDAIAKVQDGVKCITMKDDRGHHCDILSLSQVDNLLARQEALKQVQQVLNDEEGKPIVEDLLFNNLIVQ